MTIDLKKIKIIFMGTSDFAVPILIELVKKFTVIGVVTEIDKPAGRGQKILAPPIKSIAQKLELPCYQPLDLKKNPKFVEQLSQLEPELIVVAAYGKFLPDAILNLPKHGCLNVHPSLLPKYRGPSPIQTAILNGEKETGVTIILLDEGMDSGDIASQKTLAIRQDENYESLAKHLSLLGAELLINTIPPFLDNEINLVTQNNDQATYCRKIAKENAKINWQGAAETIYNQVRAFNPWPISYTFWENKKLDILKAESIDSADAPNHPFGKVLALNKDILVQCGRGQLKLIEVRLENKKIMNINDFLNGHQDFMGAILRS